MSTIDLSNLITEDGRLAIAGEVLEALFDEAPDIAFFVKDKEGRYCVVNNSLVERNGLQRKSQLKGKRPGDVCPGLLGRIPEQQDELVLHSGREIKNHLELHWSRPHEACWCLTTKLPLKNSAGEIVGLIGFSRDLRSPVSTDEIPKKMALALDHFERHCCDAVLPSDLARRSGLSLSRFGRLVKRIYGLTPSQLITRTRITIGTRILRETEKSIADVALECGFCDHSAFTRAFRSTTGFSPSEYRSQQGLVRH